VVHTEAGAGLRHLPLEALHEHLGARFEQFAGWWLPRAYPTGEIAEHLACRRSAAFFDVSHLGSLLVGGPHAFDLLQRTLTNDLRKAAPGRAQYSHLLAEDGSVLDDVVVWWVAPERFEVVANAANRELVAARLSAEDLTEGRVLLAVQGPCARDALRDVWTEAASVARFAVKELVGPFGPGVVAGTGYTGEDGVELALTPQGAEALVDALVARSVVPAGLAARDSLRLEAGLPLMGQDIGPGITPFEAGLGWVVAFDKGPFPGRDALLAMRSRGVRRLLLGLVAVERRPLRPGCEVRIEGALAGRTTSGGYSPVLERGIALALLEHPAGGAPSDFVGADAVVELRGRQVPVAVVRPPFVALGARRRPTPTHPVERQPVR
jgi:aminomethyltransferase